MYRISEDIALYEIGLPATLKGQKMISPAEDYVEASAKSKVKVEHKRERRCKICRGVNTYIFCKF